MKTEEEKNQEPLFDDVADDINFSGNIIRSAITITEETVEVDD